MKYIKKFESQKYNIGDYIFVETNDKRYTGINIARITNNYDMSIYKFVVYIDDKYPLHIKEREIIRKLNAEELKDFLIKKDTEKYNL